MSEYELNRGKLIPITRHTKVVAELIWNATKDGDPYNIAKFLESKTVEEFAFEEIFEWKSSTPYRYLNGTWYELSDHFCTTDCYDIAELNEQPDGTIDFLTYHYNGGASWEEVVEEKMVKNNS